jgi:hypothetical protein
VKRFTIDGRHVLSFADFIDAANAGFIVPIGGKWSGNLDALNDYLAWPQEEYELELLGADVCARSLGRAAQADWLRANLRECHPSNFAAVEARLARAEAGQGETLFEVLKRIIDGNPRGRLVLRTATALDLPAHIAERVRDVITRGGGKAVHEEARAHGAIALSATFVSILMLRPDGSLWDADSESDRPLTAVAEEWRIPALVWGVEKFPWLAELLPLRPSDAPGCDPCGGSGRILNSPALCAKCRGLGWTPPIAGLLARTRTYEAIVWVGDSPGQRLTLEARNGEEATKYLRDRFGPEAAFKLYNEEDANMIR